MVCCLLARFLNCLSKAGKSLCVCVCVQFTEMGVHWVDWGEILNTKHLENVALKYKYMMMRPQEKHLLC